MSKYIVACFFIIVFTSCEDFFATTIKVDPPEHKEQIVFQTFGSNLAYNLEASVAKSVGLLDDVNVNDNFINDATVQLFEGDNLITDLDPQTIDPQNFSNYNYRKNLGIGTTIFEEGKTYTYQIDHPTYGEVVATQKMPVHIPVKSSKYKEGSGVDIYGNRTDQAEIIFQDPAGETNYYEFIIARERDNNGQVFYDDVWATSNDLNVFGNDYGSTLLLSDEALDGKEYKLVLNFDNYFQSDDSRYFVIWRNVTEDYFLYAKSVSLFRESSDFEGFAEPVSLHSNINNGLGVFGLRAEQVYLLQE